MHCPFASRGVWPMPSGTGGRLARQRPRLALFATSPLESFSGTQTMIAMSISSRNGRESGYRRWWLLLALAIAAGCSGQQSPQQRIDKALALAGMKGTPLYKIAGTVTVDGLPPERKQPRDRLVAVLYDPQAPN